MSFIARYSVTRIVAALVCITPFAALFGWMAIADPGKEGMALNIFGGSLFLVFIATMLFWARKLTDKTDQIIVSEQGIFYRGILMAWHDIAELKVQKIGRNRSLNVRLRAPVQGIKGNSIALSLTGMDRKFPDLLSAVQNNKSPETVLTNAF